jgi:hypothetical protein
MTDMAGLHYGDFHDQWWDCFFGFAFRGCGAGVSVMAAPRRLSCSRAS